MATKKSPALLAEICERIAKGESLRSICAGEGMPAASTVCLWTTEDEAFGEQYARAQEARAQHYAEEIVAIADEEKAPDDRRVRIDARKWVASKLLPKRYGDKIDHTHGGELVVRIVD